VYRKNIFAPGTLWFHPECGWYVPALVFTVTNPRDPVPWKDDWKIVGISTEQAFIPDADYVLAAKAATSHS
jgi:hypothetical protein